MKPALLSPVPQGTRWPSGDGVDLAMLSLSIEEIAERIGLPLAHGFEDGFGRWSAIGGRLPSGTDIEIICYLRIPQSVFVRVDKRANHAAALDEALAQFKLARTDLKHVFPLA
jgi:hypothetical protein